MSQDRLDLRIECPKCASGAANSSHLCLHAGQYLAPISTDMAFVRLGEPKNKNLDKALKSVIREWSL